jgi:outer membrane protein assembly factor BamE
MHKYLLPIYLMSIASCSVYKIDVRQGNYVTQEMVDQLELQMPAARVQFLMGTPLIVDVFHQKRWDYLYSFQPNGKERQQRHLSLFFDDQDQLLKIEGDVKVGNRKPQQPISPPVEEGGSEPIL